MHKLERQSYFTKRMLPYAGGGDDEFLISRPPDRPIVSHFSLDFRVSTLNLLEFRRKFEMQDLKIPHKKRKQKEVR
jgi:hypothetical protein